MNRMLYFPIFPYATEHMIRLGWQESFPLSVCYDCQTIWCPKPEEQKLLCPKCTSPRPVLMYSSEIMGCDLSWDDYRLMVEQLLPAVERSEQGIMLEGETVKIGDFQATFCVLEHHKEQVVDLLPAWRLFFGKDGTTFYLPQIKKWLQHAVQVRDGILISGWPQLPEVNQVEEEVKELDTDDVLLAVEDMFRKNE